MSDLDIESVIVRSDRPLTAPVDGELVMLDPGAGTYFGLDEIGQRIWDLIARPAAVSTVCAELMEHYEVDEATCHSDVLALVAEMVAADLVEVRS